MFREGAMVHSGRGEVDGVGGGGFTFWEGYNHTMTETRTSQNVQRGSHGTESRDCGDGDWKGEGERWYTVKGGRW